MTDTRVRTVLADGRELTYPRTLIMGIINVTEDSFFAASRAGSPEAAVETAGQMLADGADMLDIGGESTRPGSNPVDSETEKRRVSAAVSAIKKRFPKTIISADTYRAATAQAAIDCGADIINDISALEADPAMAETARRANAPVILMHTRGTPRDMQKNAVYQNASAEVRGYLANRVEFCKSHGIPAEKVIIDPGLGFAKLLPHNLDILKNIDLFMTLGVPVLIGASRKTFIGQVLGSPETPLPPDQRLTGTLAVTAYCARHDAHIVRVHDVVQNVQAVRMTQALCTPLI